MGSGVLALYEITDWNLEAIVVNSRTLSESIAITSARVRPKVFGSVEVANLFQRHWLLRFFNDFLKARIVAQRIPPRM